jgi:predicted ATP-grasp superfamily ATP-dependent carboligase
MKPVVLLDLAFGGYGVVRSFSPYGIPVIGFYTQRYLPESRTSLCSRKVYYQGETDLLEKLSQIVEDFGTKPLLILTSDHYVTFFLKNRKFIKENFLIHMPSDDS